MTLKMETVPSVGIDFLLKDDDLLTELSHKKVALLTNQMTRTKDNEPSAQAIQKKLGTSLTCVLTPEHGWSGRVAEGVKVEDSFESHFNLPLYSLYGGKKFSEADFDVLIIDLQDVGLRCFTYAASCAKFIETLKDQEVIVCDRPNPLGPQVKGSHLDSNFRSLLAYLDVPFQHGQTIGELLSIYDPHVIPCHHNHHPYGYPWQPPSPNLPSWDSVLLYPTLVFLEGTNISEGRGTNLPFTRLGAPGLDRNGLVEFLNEVQGLQAEPIVFTPQSGKLKGQECHGAQLFIIDHLEFEALSTGYALIKFLRENYSPFQWTPMSEGFFIDFLLGTDSFRKEIEKG